MASWVGGHSWPGRRAQRAGSAGTADRVGWHGRPGGAGRAGRSWPGGDKFRHIAKILELCDNFRQSATVLDKKKAILNRFHNI